MKLGGLLATLVVGAVAGCGVPIQDTPVRVEADDVPTPLLAPETPVPTAPTARPGRSAVEVYFVRDAELVASPRPSTGSSPAEHLAATLDALVAGPTENEQATGLTTTLPPGLELRVTGTAGRRVDLELVGETDARSATENVLAVGQIVLSVTALPAVDEVGFRREGAPTEVLLPGGALTTDPVTATDYAPLRAR